MKLPTLYHLTDEYLQAFLQLQELDMPDDVVRDTLEGLQYPIEQKGAQIAQMARNMETLADQIDDAAKAMRERAVALKKRGDRLRGYLKENMERAGIKKIECPYFAVSIRANPPSVAIDAGAQIPDRFMRIPPVPAPEPDKKLIKEALERGESIDGCRIDRPTRLEIK